MKAKRRISSATIRFLSLCPRGKNGIETIYNELDNSIEMTFLTNGYDVKKGELLFVAYAPEMVDFDGRVASAQVIKDALYESMQNGLSLDMRHDFKVIKRDQAFIAESFIVQPGDPRFTTVKDYSGKVIDVAGAWGGVVKILDPDLKKLYEVEDWRGISMAGYAVTEPIANEIGDNPMTSEEIKALTLSIAASLTEANKPLVEALKLAVVDKAKEPEKKAKPAFVPKAFRGDISDELALEAHMIECALGSSNHNIDFTDVSTIAAHIEAARPLRVRLEEIKNEMTQKKSENGDNNATEIIIKSLEAQILTLRKKSGQPAKDKDKKEVLAKGDVIMLSTEGEVDATNDLLAALGMDTTSAAAAQ